MKCGRDPGSGSSSSPGRLAPLATRTTHRATDEDPPARKAAQAVTYATQDESSLTGTSEAVSFAQYSAPPASVVCPFPSSRRRATLPLPLPHFAAQNVALDNAQSLSVATQLYPSSPGAQSSTPCFDLANFDSSSPVSDVAPVVPVVPGVVASPELDATVMDSDLSTITSWFSPLTVIYGECRPGGRRIADVLRRAGSSSGDIPGRRPLGDT